MKAHIECASEEHLSKTWSKLLKTTERLSELEVVEGQIEDLQTQSESMKKLLDKNGEEISDLRLSEKKLEVENMELKKGVAELRRELKEVKHTAACDQEKFNSLERLVQTMQTKIEAMGPKSFDWKSNPTELDCQSKQKEPSVPFFISMGSSVAECPPDDDFQKKKLEHISRYVYGNFANHSSSLQSKESSLAICDRCLNIWN